MPELAVRAGQDKIFFTRTWWVSDAAIDVFERPAAIDALRYDRDIGVRLHGWLADMVYYHAGVSNGAGANKRNDNIDLAAVIRLEAMLAGDKFEPTQMTKRLSAHGYLRVEQVSEPGEFAVRGAVFDVFPTGSDAPVRVDLFDDEIETLRTFDAQTQLSAGKTDEIEILPAREFPFDEAAIKAVSGLYKAGLEALKKKIESGS